MFGIITPDSGVLPPLPSFPPAQTHTHRRTHVFQACAVPLYASVAFRARVTHAGKGEGAYGTSSLYQLKPTLALATHFLDHSEFIFPLDTLYAPDIS